jgi:hypothetical protein
MNSFFTYTISLISLLSVALPSQDPERDLQESLDRLLKRFDEDKDGRISRDEFPGRTFRFRRFDQNRDGFLDQADVDLESDEQVAERETPAGAIGTEEANRFFEEKIRPVLVDSCYRCHSSEGDRIRGGLVLDNRETLLIGGSSGPAVIPGNPDASLLVIAMRYTDEDLEMPPKTALPPEVVSDFERWVELGAPWPGSVDPETAQPYESQVDIEAGRSWWSFQPPVRHEVPEVKNQGWPWNEVDHFLLAEMEQRELQPVGDADDREWLRRVSLDLIGLPPTLEEIELFQSDRGKDRYENVVDRLLDSPGFGERWGRHWLDIARYGESAGRDANFMYPHAWRYRDYVIESFDQDVPYDRFLLEQLAGDLLPAENSTDRARLDIATGYLAIGSKSHITRDPRQFAADLADEQVNAVSQGILGVTVSCARCHDHKFDPIPASDYYSLAGIFASSETQYGTFANAKNRHPSDLVKLPSDARVPDGPTMDPIVLRVALQQQERLKKQAEEFPEPERRRRRRQMDAEMEGSGESMEQNRARQRIVRNQLATLEGLFERFDDEGRPTSANRVTMGMSEGRPRDVPLLVRGDIEAAGPLIPRGVPQVLSVDGIDIPAGSSGRLELANWIGSSSNPLTARVWTNRVWLHLFGQGLVTTPNNLGASGQAPSHPELLDWLAVTFVEDDEWSTKALVKRLVTSRAYHLAAHGNKKNSKVDPEVVYLWRMPDRRLDAEVIRDSMLFVAGKLDLDRPVGSLINMLEGQPSRERYVQYLMAPKDVRSIYLPSLRDHVPEALEVFDAADPSFVTGDRKETSVATQALYLMNDEQVLGAADALALRVLSEESSTRSRIDLAFEISLGREPSQAEVRAVQSFLKDFVKLPAPEREERPRGRRGDRRGFTRSTDQLSPEGEAWSAFVQSLFLCAEFRYAG